MPRSEDVSYRWESIRHPYVPGYTLKRYVGSTRKGELVEGWSGDLNIQQDINRERWLYGVNMEKKGLKGLPPERKVSRSGHAPSLEQAKIEAERLLELLSEKPVETGAETGADDFG